MEINNKKFAEDTCNAKECYDNGKHWAGSILDWQRHSSDHW